MCRSEIRRQGRECHHAAGGRGGGGVMTTGGKALIGRRRITMGNNSAAGTSQCLNLLLFKDEELFVDEILFSTSINNIILLRMWN